MKRVFLEETIEPHLEYVNAAQYQRDMSRFLLPSDCTALHRHALQVHRFLDDLADVMDTAYAAPRTDGITHDSSDRFAFLEEQPVSSSSSTSIVVPPSGYTHAEMRRLCRVLWNWYNDVRLRRIAGVSAMHINRYYYWSAFMRAFRLCTYNDAARHAQYTKPCVDQMEYDAVVRARFNLVVGTEPVGALSVGELWGSMRLVVRSLYTYSYSPAMKEYVHALYYRYATFIDCQHEGATEEMFDDARYVVELDEMQVEMASPQQAQAQHSSVSFIKEEETVRTIVEEFKQGTLRVTAEYGLTRAFVTDGEKLFYHQLYRLQLSSRFSERPTFALRYASVHGRATFVAQALIAWRAFIIAVAEDKRLRSFVMDDGFKPLLVDMHMFHGEQERFCDAYPEMPSDNREVLMEMRPNDLIAINQTHKATARSLVDVFYAAVRIQLFGDGAVDDGGAACARPFPAPLYELESMLLTRICTNVWYTSTGAMPHPDRMLKACVYEELVPLDSLDALLRALAQPQRQRTALPTLVKLMRCYYVVARDGRVFATHLFIEAHLVWQALWVRDKLLPRELVHAHLLPVLDKIITLL